mmetsp:Transcript_14321/g.38640  ORF Transcript_14321/g.38640 Transcript_14321/m.38640 type:complete len:419 (+) Transcript_14321:95-1351(+)
MPELPEAESQRRTLERCVVGLRITTVVCTEQGGGPRDGLFDDKVIAEGVTPGQMDMSLRGKWIISARRRGKQLWFELGDLRDDKRVSLCLLVHLGMTGALSVRGEAGPTYKRFTVDTSNWPPRFTKLEFLLDGGATALAFSDARRFGRVLLREGDATASPPVSLLAPDPITDPISEEAFAEALAKPAIAVKAALLDQGRVVCGVGNWVADEVLYHARIVPSAPCRDLSRAQVSALHAALMHVCQTACAVDADSSEFPPTWLFHHRWANQTSGSIASPLGRIHFETCGGRTSAFIPAVQKGAAASAPAVKKQSKGDHAAAPQPSKGRAGAEVGQGKPGAGRRAGRDCFAGSETGEPAALQTTKGRAKGRGKRTAEEALDTPSSTTTLGVSAGTGKRKPAARADAEPKGKAKRAVARKGH